MENQPPLFLPFLPVGSAVSENLSQILSYKLYARSAELETWLQKGKMWEVKGTDIFPEEA